MSLSTQLFQLSLNGVGQLHPVFAIEASFVLKVSIVADNSVECLGFETQKVLLLFAHDGCEYNSLLIDKQGLIRLLWAGDGVASLPKAAR